MGRGRVVAAAIAVVALTAFVWLLMVRLGGHPVTQTAPIPKADAVRLAAAEASPTPTGWFEIVTPPAGWDERVAHLPLESDAAVLAFVTRNIRSARLPDIVESHVKKALRSDIALLDGGPGSYWPTLAPGETPVSHHPESPDGKVAMWLVGLRLREPVAFDVVVHAMEWGSEYQGPPPQDLWPDTDYYFVLDTLGNVVESVGPNGIWRLEDIDGLPEAP